MLGFIKKLAYLILVVAAIFYASLYWAFTPQSTEWERLADSTTPRFEGPGARVGDKLYLFFGYVGYREEDHLLIVSNDVSSYDLETDTWQRHAPGPFAGTHVVGAYDGEHVWFAGGFAGNHPGKTVAEVWRYTPADDSWIAGPPLPEPVGGGSLVVAGDELHHIGGYYAAEEEPAVPYHWKLDLSDVDAGWQSEPTLPSTRGHSGVAAIGDEIYIIGGSLTHHPTWIDTALVHRYDTKTDSWTELAPLPYPASHFEPGTIVKDGDIYIVGGRAGNSRKLSDLEMQDILVYRVQTNTWELAGSLPIPIRAPVATFLNDRLVVTTGSTHFAQSAVDTTYGIVCADSSTVLCGSSEGAGGLAGLKLATKSFYKSLATKLPWRVQKWLGLKYFANSE